MRSLIRPSIFLLIVLFPFTLLADCNNSDPCAPKKVKDAWAKSVAIGFNLTTGNSDTTLATVLGSVGRETDSDIIGLNLGYNFGNSRDKTSDEKTTTRNDLRGDAAYNYKLTEDAYAGLGVKYLHDQIADISYRLNINPTVGYFVVKNPDTSLALEGGPGYTFEEVADTKNDYFSPRIADKFDWVISCTSKFFQKSELLIDVDDSDNYIFNSEIGVEAAISSQLSLVVSFKDLYDNLPAPGADRNDTQLISALKVAL